MPKYMRLHSMKKILFCCLMTMFLISCDESTSTMRDYKDAPALIEHCMTLSDDEIVRYMEKNGYSLVGRKNAGTSEDPYCYLSFLPSSVLNRFPQRGEELVSAYYDSGDFFFCLFFETSNFAVQGGINFKGEFDKKMTLYKAYSKWAYKNLSEFSTYKWSGNLGANDYYEGSLYGDDIRDYGGFNNYMHDLEEASKKGENFLDFTGNDAVGPNNKSVGVILPDYEILFQSDDCYYIRTCLPR